MRAILKFFKRVFLFILSLVVLFVIAVVLFVNFAPQIGQTPKGDDLQRIAQSPHWRGGKFENLIPTSEGELKDVLGTLKDFFTAKHTNPDKELPVKFGLETAQVDTLSYITWYGHSAFLIELQGKRILIDPMLGDYSAPISFGAKRFPYQKAIPIDSLPFVDILILSHDHYDHLDYPSILKLKDRVGHYYTALGVGAHLKSWGIAEDKITELDWWESASLAGIDLIACPARHFSGRGFSRNKSQWASWVIRSSERSIYFSGDGGYGPHFKEIGAKYGPFDFAMMECGQYNPAWSQIHMMPEESVQAGLDVKAKLMMPIHWGAFKLSLHTWTDPITRFKQRAEELQADYIHPMVGERFALEKDRPLKEWWLDL